VIYDGLKRVNHNQRPNFSHDGKGDGTVSEHTQPVFNVPTIMGRLFNGDNFGPLPEAVVELLWNGELVEMKNKNWQNPYQLVPNAEGSYSFWPAPAIASKADNRKIFEYTLRVSAPEFETLNHFFKIPVISEDKTDISFTLDRTFKLPDLYLFSPGEAEKNDNLD
jgi:competence protein ComFB